jgi:archaellum biogenesis ATPase FlaH
MRARNIKDKQLYVFIQNTNYQSAVSCESTYRTYVNNMAHFNVSSSQITDKLFNLAIYIEAYSV